MKVRENGKSALKLILFILHFSQFQVTFIRQAGMYLSFDILNAKLLKQREQIQISSSVVLNTVYSHNRTNATNVSFTGELVENFKGKLQIKITITELRLYQRVESQCAKISTVPYCNLTKQTGGGKKCTTGLEIHMESTLLKHFR